MALLSSEDVLNKAFSKTKYREGFDQDEVDDFLDEVAHTITSLTAERDDLAQRLAQAQAGAPAAPSAPATDSGATQSTEGGLLAAATDPTPSPTGMLAMAQKLHDEYVQAGEETRDRLIDEGKAKAESIVEQAETDAKERMDSLVDERSELERKIDDLRRFERDYRARLKSYLENLLGDLDFTAQEESASGNASASTQFGSAPSAASPVEGAGTSFGAPASAQSARGTSEAASTQSAAPAVEPSTPASSAPSAPASPWAQVREGSASAASASESEKPAPWGASGYQPTTPAPHSDSTPAPQSDVASAFGAPVEPESDNKNF